MDSSSVPQVDWVAWHPSTPLTPSTAKENLRPFAVGPAVIYHTEHSVEQDREFREKVLSSLFGFFSADARVANRFRA